MHAEENVIVVDDSSDAASSDEMHNTAYSHYKGTSRPHSTNASSLSDDSEYDKEKERVNDRSTEKKQLTTHVRTALNYIDMSSIATASSAKDDHSDYTPSVSSKKTTEEMANGTAIPRSNRRLLNESLSLSDLQAQHHMLELYNSKKRMAPASTLVSRVCKKSASPSLFEVEFAHMLDSSPHAQNAVTKEETMPATRTRRATGSLTTPPMTYGELQAQERELARFAHKMKTQSSSQVHAGTKMVRMKKKAKESRIGSYSSSNHNVNEIVTKVESSQKTVMVDTIVAEKIEIHDMTKVEATQVRSSSVSKVKSENTRQGARRSIKKVREGSNVVGTIKGSVIQAAPAVVSDILPFPRDATDTVIHSTSWRETFLKVAPSNILIVDGNNPVEFCSELNRPLSAYDKFATLENECKILPSFGEAKQFASSNLSSGDKDTTTQEEMDKKVAALIEQQQPRILECYRRKTNEILRETRSRVTKYLKAHASNRHTSHIPASQRLKLVVCPTERLLMKQIMQPKHITHTTDLQPYTLGWGEEETHETQIIPRDTYELRKLKPLSRSTTFIGIKSSVRVDDDPILRHIPYFGDEDDGEAIDAAHYEKIRSKAVAQHSALDDEVNEYLLRLVVANYGDSDKVFNALKNRSEFAQAYTDYGEIKKLHDSRRIAARKIEEAKKLIRGCSKDDAVVRLFELTSLFDGCGEPMKSLSERLSPPPTYFNSNLVRYHLERLHGLGLHQTSDYAELSVTYRDLFCRMCYKYDCHEHGIKHPLPSRRADPVNPVLRLTPIVRSFEMNTTDEEQDVVSDRADMFEKVSPESENKENKSIKAEDLLSTEALQERRRSERSQTRASTISSSNLELQSVRPEKNKSARLTRPKVTVKAVDESEYIDNSHFEMVEATVKASFSANMKCSEHCWKNDPKQYGESNLTVDKGDVGAATTESPISLTPTELVLLQKLRYTIGRNACMIASIIKSITCKDLHAYLSIQQKKKSAQHDSMDEESFSPDVRTAKSRKRGRSTTTNNREMLKRTRYQRLKDIGWDQEYEPCNHEGVCDATGCSCMTRNHICEKACSCSQDCSNRFDGCKCSYGNCRTNACPCFVALRECNPDLCFTCGASEGPALVYNDNLKDQSATTLGICHNVNILRGLHKKLGIAFSVTHGWGAFAREPIKRGEFIYEYKGAMLSHDEAERRGSIYDKMTISFLFNANEDTVVDAIRMGNKSKFANHSSINPKCKAKILRVGGEHRISIWAQQDIAKGEELFFNYGYRGESAPDWSQLRITGSSRSEVIENNDKDGGK